MSLAEFKDLCLDATNPEAVGEFWSAVLGLEARRQDGGDAYLTGTTASQTVWISGVPEAKTTKNRLHLDVYGTAVESLQDLGASVIDGDSFPWVVMADPEGGEFCLFIRDEPPPYRLYEIVMDCIDPSAQSKWWVECIGGRRGDDERGFSFISNIPNAPFEQMSFVPVSEAKTSKNRVHIDVVASDVEALVQAGATLLHPRDSDIGWSVLADPEGNEFCVFAAH
ncbi:MAG: VOC family protein [Acidimicrobiales bacterium]